MASDDYFGKTLASHTSGDEVIELPAAIARPTRLKHNSPSCRRLVWRSERKRNRMEASASAAYGLVNVYFAYAAYTYWRLGPALSHRIVFPFAFAVFAIWFLNTALRIRNCEIYIEIETSQITVADSSGISSARWDDIRGMRWSLVDLPKLVIDARETVYVPVAGLSAASRDALVREICMRADLKLTRRLGLWYPRRVPNKRIAAPNDNGR